MKFQGTSVGLDVHARSVVGCGLDRETGEVFQRRLTPSREEVGDWIRSLPAPAVVVYEAGPTGFGLARYLIDAGIECVVAAPSKLQRPAGDRVKTDLLTELSASSRRGCVRRRVRLVRFAAREQRCECAAGVVRAGGAAAGFAGGDRRAVRAVSAG